MGLSFAGVVFMLSLCEHISAFGHVLSNPSTSVG